MQHSFGSDERPRVKLPLSIAFAANPRTQAIIDGRATADGIDMIANIVHPSELFWRQLKFADWDVAEMSFSSLMMAIANGDDRFIGLPIFTTRRFFHSHILVRRDSAIEKPADLKGRRVGVTEYQQTAALWSRGILEHEFNVAAREIEWFMERGPDKSHGGATGFKPPEGVRLTHIAPTTNIGEMLMNGTLDATLLYLTNRNLVDRSTADLSQVDVIGPLFPDKRKEMARYFAKTGIYPINHAVVIKRELYEKHPWLALNLYHVFMAAKTHVEQETTEAMQSYFDTGLVDPASERGLKNDPKAYGMEASRPVIETIAQYVFEQGLTDRKVEVEELFAPSTLEV